MASLGFFRSVMVARMRVFTESLTTAATLKFGGTHVIFSTATTKRYNIAAPKVGEQVNIVCRRGTTALTANIMLPTGFSFQRTSNSTGTTHRRLVFNAGNQMATLTAISTSKIAFLAASGVVTNTT